MEAFYFRITLNCPHCHSGMPVNGITAEIICDHCLNSIFLPPDWWDMILDAECLSLAEKSDPAVGFQIYRSGGLKEAVHTGTGAPACQQCNTVIPEQFVTGATQSGTFTCGCGQSIRIRPATALAQALICEAGLLVHEGETGENLAEKRSQRSAPATFPCMTCGAALAVDGSSRTPACDHCGNINYLPDALWLRLHPATESQAFYVTRLQEPVSPVPTALPASLTESQALRLLRDPRLPADALSGIPDRCTAIPVLMRLASHPLTPLPALLGLTASSLDDRIHVCLAQRPSLQPELLSALALLPFTVVRKALLQRPDFFSLPEPGLSEVLRRTPFEEAEAYVSLPQFPEWRLWDLSANRPLSQAMLILRSPNVSLRVLKRLWNREENRGLVQEHPLYQALPWYQKLFF